MRRASVAIAFIAITSHFCIALSIVPLEVHATTLYVGGAGLGNYTTIQNAIDNASSGDTIFVYSGVYNERLSIGKAISLIGQGRDSTIIDGNRSEDVVRIETSWVNFSGFTVRNSGRLSGIPYYIANSGLKLKNAENCTVTDNNFTDNFVSLYLYYNSRNNSVFGNIIYDNVAWGIGFYKATWNTITDNIVMRSNPAIRAESSSNNTFTSNSIIKNSGKGVWLYNSVWNFIDRNNVSEDFGEGFYLMGGGYNVISNNTINSNQGDGIKLWTSYGNIIVSNHMTGNENNSLTVTDSRFNVVVENTMSHSGKTGAHLVDSKDNLIFHNNFDSNPTQARDNIIGFMGSNSWDFGYPFGGNYWSDYSGPDIYSGPNQDQPGSDGIGDSYYPIVGGDSEDRYPLMSPDTTFPSPPRDLLAARGDSQLTLTWTPPEFDGYSLITNYRIYRGTEPGDEVFLVETGNVLTLVDTGLANGLTYYYIVTAVNVNGEGPHSNRASGTPGADPLAPLNLTAMIGDQEVILTWSEPLDDGGFPVANYRIYRGDTPGGETFLTDVGNVIVYTDTGLTKGNTYYYQVSAENMVGEGPRSNEVIATMPANQPPECVITSPIEGEEVEGIVTIHGTASDPDGDVQEVEIRIDNDNWITASGSTTWIYDWDTESVDNGLYTIRARSYDGEEYSAEANVTISVDNPSTPTDREPQDDWVWIGIGLAAVIVVVLLLIVFIFVRKRKREDEEEPVEPPPEDPEAHP